MACARTDDGRRHVVCLDCGSSGPVADTSGAAIATAKASGWTRIYRGHSDTYRCPECRGRPNLALRARDHVHACPCGARWDEEADA